MNSSLYLLALLALFLASVGCALSLAVALRVKRLLDPLVQEGLLSRRSPDAVPTGARVPATPALADVDGEPVRLPADSDTPWLLTFQAVGCSGCKAQLPGYRRFLEAQGLDRNRVISVISGSLDGMDLYRRELDAVSRIVPAVGPAAELVEELGVTVFPTYLVVAPSGEVVQSEKSSARLRQHGPLSTPLTNASATSAR
ncbi:hypothetical protein [Streptomyces sp. NPDC007369]|uniref:TlpA family protein disulfide reductase n=1 Tax=Streptomyces sp. NPDC007369 TaxID=3154589 RepID=UPI0033EFFD31